MWKFKRKLLYALITFISVTAILVFLMRGFLFPEPICTDGKKNGFETGIDCGGTCALICKNDVKQFSVLFSKAVTSGYETYDLVALVANANIDNASREVGYTFVAYDEKGSILKLLSGSTTVPLDGKFPLIIQSVKFPRPPVNVVVTLIDGPHYKVTENPTSPTVKISERKYEPGSIPRVYATVVNTKRIVVLNLPVRVLLYDANDNVYAVAETVIPTLQKEEAKQIILTWNEPLPFAPTRIGVYPIFNPFEALPTY